MREQHLGICRMVTFIKLCEGSLQVSLSYFIEQPSWRKNEFSLRVVINNVFPCVNVEIKKKKKWITDFSFGFGVCILFLNIDSIIQLLFFLLIFLKTIILKTVSSETVIIFFFFFCIFNISSWVRIHTSLSKRISFKSNR